MNVNDKLKREWRQYSTELTEWAWQRLFSRTDTYPQWDGLSWKRHYTYGKIDPLTFGKVNAHFNGYCTIGTYTISRNNTCKYLALDIDKHEDDDVDPELNLAYALQKYADLQALGFHPLLEDSNGAGGYHVWVLFDDLPASDAYHFGFWLVRDVPANVHIEVFPKQPNIDIDASKVGNLLRVLGKHHKRSHWSEIYCDSCDKFVSGKEAIRIMLGCQLSANDLIPDEALEYCPPINRKLRPEDYIFHCEDESTDNRPGYDFNKNGKWADVLEPHGWQYGYSSGSVQYWTRPGKMEGCSASINHDGNDLLYVFSSNATPFQPQRGYAKFTAYALLNHNGDFAAAAAELAEQGYGRVQWWDVNTFVFGGL